MRVLVVEDDVRIARLVERALHESGHDVEVAHDGAAGLARAGEGSWDVVVLDVLLPEIDGREVCRQLRREGVRTPILLLTALGEVRDRVAGLDGGADDYLTKPFAVDELLARVRALGRRAGSGADDVLRTADLVLDLARHEAHRGDRRIELTAREFQLLELLMRNFERVLTKEQIRERVWGRDSEASANAIETYIHYLRDKVDKGTDRPLIRTVRGVGYALRE
ncbi:MAG: response regulator transcription factor [Candidatus Limnocylindria bacterium]